MLKNYIKLIVPPRFHRKIGRFVSFFLILSNVIRDVKIYFTSYFNVSPFKLEGLIIKEYHRLEKSLSNPSFASNRGVSAAFSLLSSLEKVNTLNYKFNHQYYVGLKVLEKFVKEQNSEEIWVKEIHSRLSLLNKNRSLNDNLDCGIHDYKLSIDCNTLPFTSLVKNRRSVRFFTDKLVDISTINKALSISSMTPSVCNRQAWFTFVVQSSDCIEIFRDIHKGFSDKKLQKLNTLLVVTFRRSMFSYPSERFQGYTDGGLYSMSLMYALTSLGVSSCPLNANLSPKKENILRSKFKISSDYGLVMFIACGYQDSTIKIPVSSRTPYFENSVLIK